MLGVTWNPTETANEGLHNCIITAVEDLGVCETQHRVGHRIKIVLDMLDQNDFEGQPVQLPTQYPLNIDLTGKLGIFLREIGCVIRPREEFDLHSIIGKKIQIVVEHRIDGRTQKTYANIARVVKPRPTKVRPSEAL